MEDPQAVVLGVPGNMQCSNFFYMPADFSLIGRIELDFSFKPNVFFAVQLAP